MIPRLLLPLLAVAACAGEAAQVTVSAEILDLNGVSEIPRGLFGIHNSPLTDEQAAEYGVDSIRTINRAPGTPVIANGVSVTVGADGKERRSGFPAATDPLVDCLFDRYQPALQLTRTDWREHLAGLGRSYGEQTRVDGRRHLIEFWNEPYLNWATLPGVSYLGVYYHDEEAEPGAPMRLKTTGAIAPGLVWHRRIFAAFNPANGSIDAVCTGRIPPDGQPGQTVKLRQAPGDITLIEGGTHEFPPPFGTRVLRQIWVGRDTAQKHYWSGPYNRQLYIDMYLAFAQALKQADPKAELAAGWGVNMFNENWDAWHLLYRPTIDATHAWMDGLHEHHYGGDTRTVAGSYEVAYAYTLARYGSRLRFWNTEAGGHLDPEQPGSAKPGNEGSPLVRATAALTYLQRDIIHLLARCPDKAYTRAAHHPHENGGDFIALRVLKPLRGSILATRSSAADLWSVASLQGDRLCVALFNDSRQARQVAVRLQVPEGRRILSVRRLGFRTEQVAKADGTVADRLAFDDQPADISDGITIAGTSAAILVATLDAALSGLPVQHWTQHVSADVLLPVAAAAPALTTIALPPAELTQAGAARLRLVLAAVPPGLSCTVNGQAVRLPDGAAWITDIPLDPLLLRSSNEIRLEAAAGTTTMLAASSLWLQRR
jgi:hypothetical protein